LPGNSKNVSRKKAGLIELGTASGPRAAVQNESMKTKLPVAVFGLALVLTGCHSIGPGSVARDRFDYSSSIGESWKRQTLLNIVKLRYLDPPIFVDVGQIVAGYSLQTGVSAGGTLSSDKAVQGDFLNASGQAVYTDRPTVTYTPLTGNKFIKGLMTPLTPDSVFFTIQSGWPADAVLFATVSEINGLKNQGTSINGVTPPDPKFMRVLQLMREIQISGAVAMRIKQDKNNQQTTLLTFRSKDIDAQTLDDIHELRGLLHLDPDAGEIQLVFGSGATSDHEVAMITRSMMQLMTTLSTQVEVPAEDLSQGRATPGWETITNAASSPRMIQIHSSKDAPKDAFAAIPYRGNWFWIDDRDLKSKRTFTFMMLLFTLADTGEKEPLPLVTIPAQ
jgi:hypothetical protein